MSRKLRKKEREQAKQIAIWRVDQVEPGMQATRTLSYHLTEASAKEDQDRRGGPPGDETPGFSVLRADLLGAFDFGAFSAEEVRGQLLHEFGPLSFEEETRVARTRVYTVWYEDRFHFGAERDAPVAVAHFATREEALRDAEARGGAGELAGYEVGVGTLDVGLESGAIKRTGIARAILAKALPEEKAMLDRVLAFLAREIASAATREITLTTRLIGDLGLSGRDGARVMAGFFKELSVDPEGFDVSTFAAEAIGVFGGASKLLPQRDITVDDLLTAAMLRRWGA